MQPIKCLPKNSVNNPLPEQQEQCQHPVAFSDPTLNMQWSFNMASSSDSVPPTPFSTAFPPAPDPAAPARPTRPTHSVTGEDAPEDAIVIRGERSLWRAVVVQALMDAANGSPKAEAVQSRREAIAWLRGTSRDFLTVAYHAGYEPDYLRRMVQAALEGNFHWRALPGKGLRQQPGRKRKTERGPSQRR